MRQTRTVLALTLVHLRLPAPFHHCHRQHYYCCCCCYLQHTSDPGQCTSRGRSAVASGRADDGNTRTTSSCHWRCPMATRRWMSRMRMTLMRLLGGIPASASRRLCVRDRQTCRLALFSRHGKYPRYPHESSQGNMESKLLHQTHSSSCCLLSSWHG